MALSLARPQGLGGPARERSAHRGRAVGVTVHLEFTLVQLAVPLVPFPSGDSPTRLDRALCRPADRAMAPMQSPKLPPRQAH